MPEHRLRRTRDAYDHETREVDVAMLRWSEVQMEDAIAKGPMFRGDHLRRVFGLAPHIPEGRATFDALVPDRYKNPLDGPIEPWGV